MNTRLDLPTVEYLFECFTPDFENGFLVWKVRPHYHFKRSLYTDAQKIFNSNFQDKLAGGLSKSTGYNTVTLDGVIYFSHRILWKMFYKEEPPLIIDHIDEDKSNNSIHNLRKSDRQSNKVKSSKVLNKSGYRGVYARKDRDSFEVRVSLHRSTESGKKDLHIGYYHDIKEAACAYNIAIKCLGYDENYLNVVNFPEHKVNTNKKFFKEVGYHTN